MEAPGERLLIRLWETLVEKGVGSLLRPWQMRREGRALADVRRQEILALAQAEQDAQDIRTGRKRLDAKGRLLALPPPRDSRPAVEGPGEDPPHPQLAARVADTLLADALRREVNVAKAVLAAEAELEQDQQEPPTRKIDDDWLFRWRDYAGTVSTEELQNLWGRVLAGENKSPGSFSLRTLEFLKSLSKQEAIEVAKFSQFAVSDFVFRGNEALLEAEGINLYTLLRMQELGVVTGVESLGLVRTLGSLRADSFERAFVSHGRVLVVRHDDATKQIRLKVWALTQIGREVIRLGTFEANEAYLRSLGVAIRDQGFTVLLARWQQRTEEGGSFFEAQNL